uniref:ATP synthase F0 subunit 8 n=1 Tax=Parachtes romandiolae TaxID=1110492 RepID=A0A516IMB0_9ARAC|nr:ATP synthase F0 subunit 8 [Parachtes romandiolae]QDP17907.1 ATP synthase F0 subunit 8 [Parachtes romandiolae]
MPQLSALPWMLFFVCSLLPLMMLVVVSFLDIMKGLIFVSKMSFKVDLKW